MDNIAGFPFLALRFNDEGKVTDANTITEFVDAAGGATDVILLAHGFRNSEAEATGLYSNFLTNFRSALPNFGNLAARGWLVGGVFWPSKAFKEAADLGQEGGVQSVDDAAAGEREVAREMLKDLKETVACNEQKPKLAEAEALLDHLDDSAENQNQFVNLVRSLLDDVDLDPTEAVGEFKAVSGSKLLETLQEPVLLPPNEEASDEGGVQSIDGDGTPQGVFSVVQSIFGAVGQFLNMTTWYVMKERSGTVGAAGVADVVRRLKQEHPAVRVHLVGHSLGGRLVTSCAKSLGTPGIVDSLSLLEAAFSHYGFSSSLKGQPGFFRDVFGQKVVKGPAIATYSAEDSVVGTAYALASRLAHDNVKAIGDENDEYGGIGRNGSQNFADAGRMLLHAPGVPYAAFPAGKLTNLNGSGGLIKNHGDVTNPAVAFAVATAISET